MVIAIDGPAGAGKSSVARAVARELGFTYLDTGAMYRAVGLASMECGEPAAQVAERIAIEVGDRVLVDGRDVTGEIRTPEVSEAASRVAADPGVRAALVARQQAIMAEGDWVADGRDIATVVAPDAAVKVFLTADPAERAARRAGRARRRPRTDPARAGARDQRDATEARSVHEPAPDAVPVDTTGLTLDEVVAQVVTLAIEARVTLVRRHEGRRRRLSRTSASRRSSTASRRRARRSCTSGRASRATARAARPSGTAAG